MITKRSEIISTPKTDVIDYEKVKSKYSWLFEKNREFVVSPDADGFNSAILLTHFLNWKLVGFYNDRALLLKNGCEQNDVVYVDVEMCDPFKKSIGNHALLPKNPKKFSEEISSMFLQCLNPNLARCISQKEYGFKYPFGTSHFLLSILSYALKDSVDLSEFLNTPEKMVAFAHADGMLKNEESYPENSDDWFRYLRFNESWNPFKYWDGFSRGDTRKARISFYGKRDTFSIQRQRGDRLSLTNGKGEVEACYKTEDGTYSIKKENKDSVLGFVDLMASILNVHVDKSLWDCWENMTLTMYGKQHTKTGNKHFKEMYSKNPVSYAVTKTNYLEYSVVLNDEREETSETSVRRRGRKKGSVKTPDKYAKQYGDLMKDIADGKMTQVELSNKHSVSVSTVVKICKMMGIGKKTYFDSSMPCNESKKCWNIRKVSLKRMA